MILRTRLGLAFLLMAGLIALLVGLAGGGLDVYAVLLLIGLLVMSELIAPAPREDLRGRLSLFVFLGVVAFIFVVVQRVRQILNL